MKPKDILTVSGRHLGGGDEGPLILWRTVVSCFKTMGDVMPSYETNRFASNI